MDEKDRMIVTFGGDDNDAGHESNSFSMDIDVPQEPSAETAPYTETYRPAVPDEYLQDYKSYTSNYEAQKQAAEEKAYDQARIYSGQEHPEPQTPVQPEPVQQRPQHSRSLKPPKDPRYVTKGALVICMVLTMIVSSLLGAFLGGALSGAGSHKASEEPRAERNDSELSQLSLGDSTGSELTVSEIVDKNADAVVEILVSGTSQDFFGQTQVTEGAGSGVIVTDNGYIVTNYHVIQGANKVQVTLHNGETYPAVIIGGVDEDDIAVIKINANGLTVAEIGDSSTVKVGDTAVAIGNPLGQLGGTATTGIISALDRNLQIEGRTMTLMQTDAAINGGNSGGGLFNSKGELIGIVDAKSSGVGIEGLAFAIPINSVSDIINDLVENGKVTTRPIVGITIQDVTEANAQSYGLEAAGVYIAQVTGENAKAAGFQQGDRIISFDGDEITDSQTFINKVRHHKVGDTVSIVVSRQGQQIEIKTVLEELTTAE